MPLFILISVVVCVLKSGCRGQSSRSSRQTAVGAEWGQFEKVIIFRDRQTDTPCAHQHYV